MKRFLSFCLACILTAASVAIVAPTAPVEAASLTKLVAFTFDDGPSDYTPRLLDGLKSLNARATFFVNGENGSYLGAKNHMSTIRRMVNEGHQVANHTYSHYVPFDGLSASSVQSEVNGVNSYLYKAVGAHYQSMVRTPGGAVSSTIRNNVNAPIILWSVDTLDWQSRNATTVYNQIMNNVTDGSIVLLHDIYSTSVTAALNAMRDLRNQGYVCVTVSELFRRRGITLKNGQVYTNAPNKGTTLAAYKTPRTTTSLVPATRKKRITVSTTDTNLTLYYTTDGSVPTMASKQYTAPLEISYDKTVNIVGYDKYGVRTPMATQAPNKTYEGVFDPCYYLNRYPELKKTCGTSESKLLNHFLTTGLSQGLQASPVFDIRYYSAKYKDLQKAFGSDTERYLEHFMTFGMKEGRQACDNFNVTSYRLYYPDLRKAYGNNTKSYYLHYIRYGYQENRVAVGCTKMRGFVTVYNGIDYAPVYDYNSYVARYQNVKKTYGLDDTAVLQYFVNNGMKNGHQACDSFNVFAYRNRYKDLRRAFGDDLKAYYTHYLKHGIKEGRIAV